MGCSSIGDLFFRNKKAFSGQLSAVNFKLSAFSRHHKRKAKMRDFRKLKVWEKAHQLALAIYKHTVCFPREEIYGLTSQMRRSCISIAANIAEGCGRSGEPELGRFLHIGLGSASELEYHLLLAADLGLLPQSDYKKLAIQVVEVKRMLGSPIQKLKAER
jgi:four helix bundle protein